MKDRTFSKEYYFGDDGNVSFVGKPKEPALIEVHNKHRALSTRIYAI